MDIACQFFLFFYRSIFIIVWIVVIVTIIVIMQYNRLVTLKHVIDQTYADIDVQLTNRFDLIENLVNTAKGYASHEQATLTKSMEARTSLLNTGTNMQTKVDADEVLSRTLTSLFAGSESYPDLKANTNFLHL